MAALIRQTLLLSAYGSARLQIMVKLGFMSRTTNWTRVAEIS